MLHAASYLSDAGRILHGGDSFSKRSRGRVQGACTELNERAARAEAALATAQAAHEQTQGALSAEAAARTEAEAQVRRCLTR